MTHVPGGPRPRRAGDATGAAQCLLRIANRDHRQSGPDAARCPHDAEVDFYRTNELARSLVQPPIITSTCSTRSDRGMLFRGMVFPGGASFASSVVATAVLIIWDEAPHGDSMGGTLTLLRSINVDTPLVTIRFHLAFPCNWCR